VSEVAMAARVGKAKMAKMAVIVATEVMVVTVLMVQTVAMAVMSLSRSMRLTSTASLVLHGMYAAGQVYMPAVMAH
jgi:hypothetical protein